ncbi:asparagine synthase (glutamine-hydrolyzing) [Paenibacillus filicis]|uniref:asparagine synthase (glutamine-hydrolyzing) n=1 Tax=Paenibacillus gyeongsangnamensis TaxID=3388067 RepID=A0ABT4QIH1_9BACL|nr:asparagine synthase (glutamine-hydrolyzing) [Paenibacillus filicis]MCZ8516501.1 asparagine synthase (glutamine-hydrolyzing) [Paenibacillus filicis]
MCGITGCVGYSMDKVKRSLNRMVERGPDNEGTWSNQDVILGHRRLSIIDLSASGHQPMLDASEEIAITFNGEIYNYLDLRNELKHQYSFRTHTDTEVILAAYSCWGLNRTLQKIRGMYAFAIWDNRSKSLIMARDPFGKKPLFYSCANGKLAFSSTLNALLEYYDALPPVNPCAIDDYLTYLAVPGDECIFEGIQKLLPGHYAIYKDRKLSVERYWHLSFANPVSISEEEALEELDRLIRKAVRSRMVSDVPIGAFLSGGVDSSLVTAIMALESGKPITTVTMGFDDPQYDETRFARKVSEAYQTDHHEFTLTMDYWKSIPDILSRFGEPFADSSALPTYFVSKQAKEEVTVILNGDGGDELFAGYTRPLAESMAMRYRKALPGWLRRPIGRYALSKPKLSPRILNGMKQVFELGMTDARTAYVFNRALRPYRESVYTPEFLQQLGNHHPDIWYQRVWDQADGLASVDKMMYGDLNSYLPDDLLAKMDTMTMAHSLEARSPLLDIELAEFTATLPHQLKIQGLDTKMLLKKLASRYVPHEVLYRPKKGFNMPIESWLRTVLSKKASELLLGKRAVDRGLFRSEHVKRLLDAHQSGKRNYAQQLWSLLCLEIWFRIQVDKDFLSMLM